ncbi:ABC transporter ATP-binding protein [Streptomyces sp. WG7]|uniref:ABC transporter ATP-binding protein n=1 Tax=Streptomyces sp. WG7 TaxID=3417650 RepID=UPI003CF7EA2E
MVARESLRILWSFVRPHRRTLGLGLLLALAASALGLATPMVTKQVLDALGDDGSLRGPVLTLLALLLVGAMLHCVEWILLGTLGEKVVLQARKSMVQRFFRATVPGITKRPPGELVSRAVSDTVLLRETASTSVVGLINGVVMLVGTLVLMAVLDLVLLGTTVAAVAVVIVLFAVLMPRIAKTQERAQEYVGRIGGTLEGTLRAIRTVKANGAEERQAERIMKDARESARHGITAVRLEAAAWTIAWTGIQLAIILILAIGAWRVGEGHMDVSSLIAFLLYAFGLMDPITELSQNLTSLQSGIAAAERIRAVDAIEVETNERHATAPARATAGPVLEMRSVTATYGPDRKPALSELNLSVPRRGHTAVVGPSGAGKTTIFSLLLRFLEPQGGKILLDGAPYEQHGHAAIRSRLAYVEQDTPVVPGTIRDNLLISRPEATDDELHRVIKEVRLTEKIATLDDGLDTELSSATISGGERQRIALARALLRRPDVLLLDEATAQLDALTESAVHGCIRGRSREGAVVTIAHRLSTVIDADTIVVMEDGRIRAQGTHEKLLASDALYRDLVEALRIADGTPAA